MSSFKPNRGLARFIPTVSSVPPVMSVVRGPSYNIRLEIGRGAARTRATPRARMHAGEEGALVTELECTAALS